MPVTSPKPNPSTQPIFGPVTAPTPNPTTQPVGT